MDTSSGETERVGASASAPESPPWARVSLAPPDAWVESVDYDAAVAAKDGFHFTYLLWQRQVNAELGKAFHSTATRLETSLAVQHQSQWRLEFDPRNQHLTVHWLRIVRAGVKIDHLRRDRVRLIQREAQLEHLVIDGRWTLLLIMEDVRPGDIVEAGYSYETKHPISTGQCEVFYYVPPQSLVGKYRLSVRFAATRPDMKWLAAPDAPEFKEEILPDGHKRWRWEGQQLHPRDEEPNLPGSSLDYVWVQVSDLTGWGSLTARLEKAWGPSPDRSHFADIPAFAPPPVPDEAAINGLIQHIQDEFRYLSINLENSGWIPEAPGVVARRRYGDCKDLAWLGVSVLRTWGVRARPMLVSSGLRARIGSLLPGSLVFDHAVLEVECNGQTRWFDLTMRGQGGDFHHRTVGWYTCGLPVDASASALAPQSGNPPTGLHALREDIYLDTRPGQPALAEQRIWYEGWQADNVRRARQSQGADEFARERLKSAQHRYNKATRVGTVQWRDDRSRNVCEIAEVFEIPGAVYASEDKKRAIFDVPPNIIVNWFSLPENRPRRTAWDMPYRLETRHGITVHVAGTNSRMNIKRLWTSPEFTATLEEPREVGAWTKIARFVVNAPEVAADRVRLYRTELLQFKEATSWRLFLPWGSPRPPTERDPGSLPKAELGIEGYVSAVDPHSFPPAAKMVEALKKRDQPPPWWKRGWRYRSASPRWQVARWYIPLGAALLGFIGHFAADRPYPYVPPTTPSTAVQNAPRVQRSEQEIAAAVVSGAMPTYPEFLRPYGIEGLVTVRVTIDEQGHVDGIGMVSSSNSNFDQPTLEAVQRWVFKPATRNGVPVRSVMRIPLKISPPPPIPPR